MTILNRFISRRVGCNFAVSYQIIRFECFSDSTTGGSKSDFVDSREEPIKFSTSPAFKHKRPFEQFSSNAAIGRQPFGAVAGNPRLAKMRLYQPWFHHFQDFVVVGSVVIFLIYFGILREENDLDEELSRPLYERVPQMEIGMLRDRIMLGKMNNEDVSKYEKRLQEIENQMISSKIRKG